ncbi:hypothetical protein BOTBODRAFT_612536 [Botryobasidium botryosum FD-172 SS1]|uniref:Uncharacterized protein n=1 Tax=Botryobasidium botryosum (strain FD-172 SS1) TaxID=930990 RepID=A0A067LW01_BOTB1|nr:hypothetical protein BOTBODRAFT_612536 [Botryobasidium botryosum FD-172 SS1]
MVTSTAKQLVDAEGLLPLPPLEHPSALRPIVLAVILQITGMILTSALISPTAFVGHSGLGLTLCGVLALLLCISSWDTRISCFS